MTEYNLTKAVLESLVHCETSCICRSRDLSEGKKRRSRTKKFSPKSGYISRRKKNADKKKTLPNPICLSLLLHGRKSSHNDQNYQHHSLSEMETKKITQMRMQIGFKAIFAFRFVHSFIGFCFSPASRQASCEIPVHPITIEECEFPRPFLLLYCYLNTYYICFFFNI